MFNYTLNYLTFKEKRLYSAIGNVYHLIHLSSIFPHMREVENMKCQHMALTNEKLQSMISVYNILRDMGQYQKMGKGEKSWDGIEPQLLPELCYSITDFFQYCKSLGMIIHLNFLTFSRTDEIQDINKSLDSYIRLNCVESTF